MIEQETNFKEYKRNLKQRFFASFKLTTHKISLISFLLAITVIVSLIEIPTWFEYFLKLDFAITVNLLAAYVVGLTYGLLISFLYPWIRLLFPFSSSGSFVGALSSVLGAVSTLIVFFFIHEMLLSLFKVKKDNKKLHLVVNIISGILVCLIVSLLNTFYNWAFILDLYGMSQQKSFLWTMYLPFNIFKYTMVLILFIFLEKPLSLLKYHFNL